MKRWEMAFAFALVVGVAGLLLQLPFASVCEEVRGDTLRVHILANSDGERDQQIKLAVRDAVVERCAGLFDGADSRDAAVQRARVSLDEIEDAADRALAAEGATYRSTAELCEMYFDERQYGGLTLPAGRYTALRLTLGEGAGRNWWCMVYPSFCLAAGSDSLEAFSDSEKTVVLGGERYAVRFKVEEWFQKLFFENEASV